MVFSSNLEPWFTNLFECIQYVCIYDILQTRELYAGQFQRLSRASERRGLRATSFAVSGYAKDIVAKPGMSLGAGRFGHIHAHATGQEIVHEAVLLLLEFGEK